MPDQDQTTTPLDVLAQLTVTVETMADCLVLTPTRVQQLYKKGIVDKDGHGVYRLLASIQGYIREINAKSDGKNSEWHRERTKKMKIDRQMAELEFLTEAGKLVPAEEVTRTIEKVKAVERQQLLFMPKQLAPRLEGDAAANEAILEEWAHQFLKSQTEITITDIQAVPAAEPEPQPEAPQPKRKKEKKKK